jgi:hypothetical protein
MKFIYNVCFLLLCSFAAVKVNAQVQVTYKLTYDAPSETYTVSMRSNTGYTSPLSRLSLSSQVTIVVPDGWTIGSITTLTGGATPLSWGATLVDNSTISSPMLSNDYYVISPSNAGTYTPFTIPANADLDLFSFKRSTAGCIGDLSLYDNTTDPLNMAPSYNADNNIVILGAGAGNKYVSNTSGAVPCFTCAAEAGVLSY